MESRAAHEIEHGRLLSAGDVEVIWGWGTPAGKIRASRRARLIAEGALLGPGRYALEIGCGTGIFTEKFAQSGAQLLALDISPDLLQRAKARGLPADRVRFLEMRFEEADVEGPFDAVIGSSVLHHLEVEAALAKIYELLKPGGIMSFAEPNMLNPQVFMERKFRRWFPYTSPDETAFIRWRLKDDLLRAGFQGIVIKPFDWLHPSTPASMIATVSRLGSTMEKTSLLRNFAGSLHICARRPVQSSTYSW